MESKAQTEFMPGALAEFTAKKYPGNLVVDTSGDSTALLEYQVLELNVFGKQGATIGVHFPVLAPHGPFVTKFPAKCQGSAGVIVIDAKGLVEVDFFFRDRPIRSNFESLLLGKYPRWPVENDR